VVAGILFGAFGRHTPFLSGAVIIAGAVILAWRLERRVPSAAEAS
jgi:hypothetical protein